MMEAKIRVMPLARLTGRLEENIPKSNQSKVPNAKREYMAREIPEVSFVLMVLMAWGIKEAVVQAAAASPRMVTVFMI